MEGGTAPEELEARIGELLEQDSFDPPKDFAHAALVSDDSLYEEAARDPEAWWAKAAGELDWFEKWDTGPRRVRCAVLQVVHGRQAERVAQLPGPACRRGPRRQGGLPLAWRGRRGARRDLRRPAARHAAARERAEGARRRAGRRRRDLPPDDSRGRRGDARLRSDRRGAQRRLRRLLTGLGQGPDAVLGREGADHRRRRAAQGQDGADQARRRRVPR